MAKKKTPLLLKLRKNSGTIYVFPSASEDVGLNLNSDINGAAITHFALLNIPSFNASDWFFGDTIASEFTNDNLAGFIPTLSLLNYMMNLETLLINQDSYNFQDLNTVTEKCFWHWMIANKTIDPNPENNKFKEIVYNNKVYYYEPDRVNNIVKCFGSVNAGNSVNNEFGIFNETYITIPSSYGGGPVFFTASENQNYQKNTYTTTSSIALEGRENITKYVSYSGNNDKPWGDKNSGSVTYDLTGDNTFNVEGLEIVKDLDTINALLEIIVDNKKYPVITYDDVNIDAYKLLMHYDNNLVSPEFDFNAILLYYSIYDANDRLKLVYATNLFGIIFLDGVTLDKPVADSTEPNPIIKGLHKRQVTDLDFGTAYSFRVNIKTMSIYDDTNATILDSNLMGSVQTVELSDAIALLNHAVDIMQTNMESTLLMQDSYTKMVALYNKHGRDIHDISTALSDLRNGNIQDSYTLESLYCNSFYNKVVDNIPNNDSSITFYLMHDVSTEYGNKTYSSDIEPYALKITHDGLHAQSISTSLAYHQHNYRAALKGGADYLIWTPDSVTTSIDNSRNPAVRLKVAKSVLALMFEENQLQVKLYHDPKNLINYTDDTVGDPVLNYLYIDEASPVFDASANEQSLKCLKDTSTGLIDYVGLIPYMVAQLQHLNEKFNYTYDSGNSIFGIDDITSIKDALNFVLNIFKYDDMSNYIAELTPVVYNAQYNAATNKWDIKGAECSIYDEAGNVYYYKGEKVIIEFKWKAGEPNNNLLGEVVLNLPNDNSENLISDKFTKEGLALLSDGKYISPVIDDFNNRIEINAPFNITVDKDINVQKDIMVYNGCYYIVNPVSTVETSITLKTSIISTQMRNLLDKTLTTKVKCIIKCYYWTGNNGTANFNEALDNIDIFVKADNTEYNAAELNTNFLLANKLKYFDFEDRAVRLSETKIEPDFIINKNGDDIEGVLDMYIYFLLPYYNDLNYNNVHVYATVDMGIGGFEKYSKPISVTDSFGNRTDYSLFRTSQKQNEGINIKIG